MRIEVISNIKLEIITILFLLTVIPLGSTGIENLHDELCPSFDPSGSFIKNGGQWNDSILYRAKTGFGHVALLEDGLLYQTVKGGKDIPQIQKSFFDPNQNGEMDFSIIKVKFLNCQAFPVIPGVQVDGYTNFIIGNQSTEWKCGIQSYSELSLLSVWKGVDIILKSTESGFKYDLNVKNSTCKDNIRFKVEGHSGLDLVDDSLIIRTPIGPDLIEMKPVAYSELDRNPFPINFNILRNDIYGFNIENFPEDQKLVIDPLVACSYVGGSEDDVFYDLFVDDNGDPYLVGHTFSSDFPISAGSYQNFSRYGDCIIVKMSSDLSSIKYCTYIGGGSNESISSVYVDMNGSAYITGMTNSLNFPTTSSCLFEESDGDPTSWDIYVTKIEPNGTYLEYSTYFPGSNWDVGMEIQVSKDGGIFVSGFSYSEDFPLKKSIQHSLAGERDIVLFSLKAGGYELDFSTYYGGEDDDIASSIDLDNSGNIFLTGSTNSVDFPTTSNAYDTSFNGWSDVVLLKYNTSSNSIVYSSFIGGDDGEEGVDIEVDGNGNVCITGSTSGGEYELFPTTSNSYCETYNGGDSDGFALKMNSACTNLIFSSYLGGSGDDLMRSMALDEDGNLIIGGLSESSDYPTLENAISQNHNGGWNDGVITIISEDGTSLVYSSYVGGSSYDDVFGVSSLETGKFVIGGETGSTDLPTTSGVYSDTLKGGDDFYAMIIDLKGPPSPPSNPNIISDEDTITITWNSPAYDGGSPLTGYNLYKRSGEEEFLKIATLDDLQYVDEDVEQKILYSYRITATNSYHEGSPTPILFAMVLSPPLPPEYLYGYPSEEGVNLDWYEPIDNGGRNISEYRIYRGLNSNDIGLLSSVYGEDSTHYLDTDIDMLTSYHYHVTAVNDIGESDASIEINITTYGPPGPPQNLTIEESDERLDLNWDIPSISGGLSVDKYNIYRGTNGSSPELYSNRNRWSTFFYDRNVTNGGNYSYYITAENEMGESEPSELVSGIPKGFPNAPNISLDSVGKGFVNISWDKPFNGGSPILRYEIFSWYNGGKLENIGNTSGDMTSFNNTGLVNGQCYFYKVLSQNIIGSSYWSNVINATPVGVPDSPELKVKIGMRKLTFNWDPPVDDGGFPIIKYSLYKGIEIENMTLILDVNKTNYIDEDFIPYTSYYYILSATNLKGESQFSFPTLLKPYDIPLPPIDFAMESNLEYVTLTWKAPLETGGFNLTGFRIYRGTDPNDLELITEIDNSNFMYIDEEVETDLKYYYSISSVHPLGESNLSTMIRGYTIQPPGPPENLQVKCEGKRIVITWESPLEDYGVPILKYNIYRTPLNAKPELLDSVDENTFEFIDDDPVKDAIYVYIVRGVNIAGEGDGSNTSKVSVPREMGSNPAESFLWGASVLFIFMSLVLVILLIIIRKSKKDSSFSNIHEGEDKIDDLNQLLEQEVDQVSNVESVSYPDEGLCNTDIPLSTDDIMEGPNGQESDFFENDDSLMDVVQEDHLEEFGTGPIEDQLMNFTEESKHEIDDLFK